jgi:hypothetical protein
MSLLKNGRIYLLNEKSLCCLSKEICMLKRSFTMMRLNGPFPERTSREISLGMESFIDTGLKLPCRSRIITCWKDANNAANGVNGV